MAATRLEPTSLRAAREKVLAACAFGVGLPITRPRAEKSSIWYLRNGEILRVGNRSQGSYRPATEGTSPDEALTRAGM